MPRRQTNFRGPKDKSTQKKAPPKRKTGRSLNALSIAENEVPKRLGVRKNRLGNDEDFIKRKRNPDREEDDSDGPGNKRRRTGHQSSDSDNGGSDSEGHEWRIGEVGSDDDSELDSDEALGSSDEERFEDFTFRGSSTSKSKPKKKESGQGKRGRGINLSEEVDVSEDEDEDEEEDDLGEDAIDLTTAWDMNTAEEEMKDAAKSKNPAPEGDFEGSESEDGDNEGSDDESGLSMSEDEGNADEPGLSKLQNFVNSMETEATSARTRKTGSRQEQGKPTEYGLTPSQKLTVADLLPSITDSQLKNSLKHVDSAVTQKSKSGTPGKLDAPLAKRQQDRMDRGAAYEKSKETLDRWLETVKANRRAEHLMFPLPDPDSQHVHKMDVAKPQTDLENTIQNILVDSGLSAANGKSNEDQIQEAEEQQAQKLPIEEIQARRAELRKRRDLLFREEVRAKRIKKIKSKSYRRRHRKEREKLEDQEKQALMDAGVDLDEEEREKNERRRAEARMGSKHRDSKWAKSLRQTGRTAWDEEARNNAADLAQREEDLRKRIEGKRVSRGDDDYLGSSSSESDEDDPWEETGSDTEKRKISDKLGALEADNADREIKGPHANLFSMKFMQNAEASRKAENDAEIRRLNRELNGEESESEAESEAGRRKFGQPAKKNVEQKPKSLPKKEFEEAPGSDDEGQDEEDIDIVVDRPQKQSEKQTLSGPANKGAARPANGLWRQDEPPAEENPWLVQTNRTNRRPTTGAQGSVDITVNDSIPGSTEPRNAPKNKTKNPGRKTDNIEDGGDSDEEVPVLLKNHDLVKRAFAGDEVVQDFEQEKLDTIEDEGDKVIDETLPGWGSWAGDGISKKQKKKQPKQLTKVEGVKAENRKDAKLSRVIINEKRTKKVRCLLLPTLQDNPTHLIL